MGRNAQTRKTGIAVVESRWFPGYNTSVAPLFNLLGEISHSNPNAYHYEMVGCEAAFKECIPRIASERGLNYLYIAMHGDEKGLCLHNDERISRVELRNILRRIEASKGSSLSGMYLGSCLFGTHDLAEYLFAEEMPLRWIAGYNKAVNWIDSSALDLQFFNNLLCREGDTESSKIKNVSERLLATASGLCIELGFGIYVRKKGNTGGVVNLLGVEQ